MTVGVECPRCEGKSSRAAVFCQWCGVQLREPEPWETSVAERRGVDPETMAERLGAERGEQA